MRKVLICMIVIIIAVSAGVSAYAADSGFYTENRFISAAETPFESRYTAIQWYTDPAEGTGVPVPFGEYLLLPRKNELLKIKESDGTVEDTLTLPEECPKGFGGALLGNTLVLPSVTGIMTVDMGSFTAGAHKSFGGEINSDIAIYDDYAYFSVRNDSGFTLYCAALSDGLGEVWSFSSEEDIADPAIVGEYIVFAVGDKITTHHYKEDRQNDIAVGRRISGSPFSTRYAVYFSTEDGYAGRLRLTDCGALEEDTLIFCEAGDNPGSPLAWNGRLYVPAENGLYILDNLNMEIKIAVADIKEAECLMVCYGSGPMLYSVGKYDDCSALYCLMDSDSFEVPQLYPIAKLEDFSGGKAAVSAGGTMYYRDGLGRVYALKKAENNMLMIILRVLIIIATLVLALIFIRIIVKRRRDSGKPKF